MRFTFNENLARCVRLRIRFDRKVIKEHPPSPDVQFPREVRHLAKTIVVQYRNERGEVMAETHHYAAGRWRLASGYEDPTLIRIDGELVDRWHKDDVRCAECGRWEQRAEESKALLPAPNRWRSGRP